MRASWLPALLVPLLLGAADSAEHTPFIKDGANLFSKEAREKAALEIKEIRDTYKRDFVVVTVGKLELPEGQRAYLWSPHRHKIREEQARELAKELGVNGVLLLVVKDPLIVTAVTWPTDHDRVFFSDDAVALQNVVSSHLKARAPDLALGDAIKKVRGILQGNRAHEIDPAQQSDDLLLSISLGSLALLALVAMLLRRKFAPTPPLPEQKPALLASLFGTPASYWICDKLFIPRRPTVAAAPPAAPAAGIQAPPGVTANPPANP
jgi:hypothetical protein